MTTPTSTIGIRGTDYAATVCLQSECRNEDGTPAKPGTYGRVIGQSHGTNQIEVSNDADRRTLGINSNFYVGDRKSTIELLLVAPEFVLSKLEGRNRGGSKGSAGGTGDEQATSGGASEESRPSTTPEPLPQLQFVVTQQLGPQGGPAVIAPAPNGFVVAYPLPNTNPNFGEFFFDDEFLTGTYNGLGQLTAYGTAGTYPSGSLNGGTITDTGSIVLTNGQVLTYGRWTGNTSNVLADGSTFIGAPVLFGTANDVQNMASVVGTLGGVATYNYAGGPKPVDAGGNVGSITSTSNDHQLHDADPAIVARDEFPERPRVGHEHGLRGVQPQHRVQPGYVTVRPWYGSGRIFWRAERQLRRQRVPEQFGGSACSARVSPDQRV